MRYFVRMLAFHSMALWLVSQLIPGLTIRGGWQVLLFAGGVLTLLLLLVAPMLRIIFIPINFLTLGLMGWLVNVAVMYLLTIIVPSVSVRPFTIPAFSQDGFSAPSVDLSFAASLIVVSLCITFVSRFLEWATAT